MSPCIFIKDKRGGGRADFAPENKRNFPFSLDFQRSSTRKLWQRDNWCLMCYLCAGFSCEVLEVVCVCVLVRFCYKCHLKILLSHTFPACFLWAVQGCAYINNEKRLLWQREVFLSPANNHIWTCRTNGSFSYFQVRVPVENAG